MFGSAAVEAVQETMEEQAKAQEEALCDVQEELRATLETRVDERIKTVNEEVNSKL